MMFFMSGCSRSIVVQNLQSRVPCLQLEEVIKNRLSSGRTEVLVRWASQTAANATWVELTEFKQLYPFFKLMDELVIQGEGGGDVMCDIQYSQSKEGKQQECLNSMPSVKEDF
jgi:hypothetical protein